MKAKIRVIVLDVIEPGVTPAYCVHGRASCAGPGCGEWLWLGNNTHDLVKAGEAVPMCRTCVARYLAPTSVMIRQVNDHLRADGPHD